MSVCYLKGLFSSCYGAGATTFCSDARRRGGARHHISLEAILCRLELDDERLEEFRREPFLLETLIEGELDLK